MKINDINRVSGVSKTYQVQNEFRKDDQRKAHQRDEVQISAEAQEMLETSKTETAERAEYLKQLKQSVQSGTYYVESGKIAEKLLPFLK